MTLPPAILLDLDDTILAFDAVADDCWRSLCSRYSAELPGVAADRLFAAITQSRAWFWSDDDRHRWGRSDLPAARRQVVARAFGELGLNREAVALQLADDYTVEREELVRPFHGALETIQELKRQGVDLALVTNGAASFQRAKLERFELARHFACILIEGEFGQGKPNHSVFEHVLKVLRRRPQEAWMIGDSLTFDIAPALSLGLGAIWVDRSGIGLPPNATCQPSAIISTLAELVQLGDVANRCRD